MMTDTIYFLTEGTIFIDLHFQEKCLQGNLWKLKNFTDEPNEIELIGAWREYENFNHHIHNSLVGFRHPYDYVLKNGTARTNYVQRSMVTLASDVEPKEYLTYYSMQGKKPEMGYRTYEADCFLSWWDRNGPNQRKPPTLRGFY